MMLVPSYAVGSIIGRGGKTIKMIEAETDTAIRVTPYGEVTMSMVAIEVGVLPHPKPPVKEESECFLLSLMSSRATHAVE